jgi:hypothetical protein
MSVPYFKVKWFIICCNGKYITVNDELKNFILDDMNYLDTIDSQHYDPVLFFKYLKHISKKYPDTIVDVNYKYEYFNHSHINEYMNRLHVLNGVITNNLIG